MIHENNLERKDFSIVLPDLIAKIQFIGFSLMNVEEEIVYGSGLILNEVAEDLQAIDKVLYPEKRSGIDPDAG